MSVAPPEVTFDPDLSPDERRELERALESARAIVDAARSAQPDRCPGCDADDWAKDGMAQRRGGAVQVFRCRECGKKRVGRADGPFRHPVFPAELMVLAVLLRRAGWSQIRITESIGVVRDGEHRAPNRQTVARWAARFDDLIDELSARQTAAVEDVPFIGRDELLEGMTAALGAGRSVLLHGPAGAGKTRLVREWIAAAVLDGAPPVVEGGLSSMLDAAVTGLGERHPLVVHHAEVLRRARGQSAGEGGPTRPHDAILHDRDAALQLIETGIGGDTVLVIDDVPEQDAATRDVVSALLDSRGPSLLLTAPSIAGALGIAVDEGRLEPLLVSPWSDAEGLAVLRAVMGRAVPDAAAVLARTGGNPRFVLEAARSLASGDGIPVSVDAALATRVRRLTPQARRVLGALSLVRGALRRPILERISAEGVEELEEADLLEVRGADGRVACHPALGDASRLGHLDWSAIRTELADALATVTPDAVDRQARLLLDAGAEDESPAGAALIEVALPLALEAGRRAQARWDTPAATAWLSEVAERTAVGGAARLEALRRLVRVLRYQGEPTREAEALSALQQAAERAGDHAVRLEYLALLARHYFELGELPAAREACERGLADADVVDDGGEGRLARGRLLWVLAMVARAEGDLEGGLETSEAALALLESVPGAEALDLRVQNHINRGNALGQRGAFDQAEAAFERALVLCVRHGLVSSAIVCTMNLGICHALQCRYGPALAHFDRARSDARRLGWRELRDVLAANQAEVECRLGAFEAAANRARHLLGRERAAVVTLSARCTLAECAVEFGDFAAANTHAPDPDSSGRARLVRAALLAAEGTRASMAQAIALLEPLLRTGAPHERAVAAARLVDLVAEAGDDRFGWSELASVIDTALTEAGAIQEGRAEALAARARLCEHSGDLPGALRWSEKAYAQVRQEAGELPETLARAFLEVPFRARVVLDHGRLRELVDAEAGDNATESTGTADSKPAVLDDGALLIRLSEGLAAARSPEAAARVGLEVLCHAFGASAGRALVGHQVVAQRGVAPTAPVSNSRRPPGVEPAVSAGSSNVIEVPLSIGDRSVGALLVYAFEASDRLAVTRAIALQTAMAVELLSGR